jgi:TrmH family RNA methyltransferase
VNFRLKRYQKDFEHSYTFGVFPTLELLMHRPEQILGIVAHPKGQQNSGVVKIRQSCQNKGIPFEFQEKTLTRIGARENDYTVGVFHKIEPGLDVTANHVILINPASLGNLGTIIRTMLGFGYRDLAIITPAADIFNPEVVRASMGALFQLNFESFPSFEAYRQKYTRNFYPLMIDGQVPLPEASFEALFGLIFGPENAGLPEEFHRLGTNLSIPQTNAIDSLNLAVSVGITLYQTILITDHLT